MRIFYIAMALVFAAIVAGYPGPVYAEEGGAVAGETENASVADEASAEDQASAFTISRAVVAEDVVELEPIGVADVFSADSDKAYLFLEATDIAGESEASVVWYRENEEAARVSLRIGQGQRWRTFASKNINGLPGQWKVEVEDAGGNVLKTVAFKVE